MQSEPQRSEGEKRLETGDQKGVRIDVTQLKIEGKNEEERHCRQHRPDREERPGVSFCVCRSLCHAVNLRPRAREVTSLPVNGVLKPANGGLREPLTVSR